MDSTTEKNWWQRNWKWLVPTAGGIILLCVICTVLPVLTLFEVLKSSEVYQMALKEVKSNPDVVQVLGEPVEPGWWLSGSIKVSGTSGQADIAIPISGPKDSGTLYVVALKTAGQWQFVILEVAVDGQDERINLLKDSVIALPPTPTPLPTLALPDEPILLTPLPTVALPPTPTPPILLPTPTSPILSTNTPTPIGYTGVRVELVIRQPSWVQILTDDEKVFEGVLLAGENQSWSSQQRVAIMAGNGGGVEVIVNGINRGLMGDEGQVVEQVWEKADTTPVSTPQEYTSTPTPVFSSFSRDGVYQQALEAASANTEVARALGGPIEGAGFHGMIDTTGALGEADIAISISGSENSGALYAVATKRRGRDKWIFTLLEVLVDGQGESIDLLAGGPILGESQQAADSHYERGYNYSNSGRYEQAMAEYTKAIGLDPEFAAAYNSLCWTGSLSGQATEVMEACERGVELAPDNGMYRDSRGLARALTGDYAGAIEDFRFFVTWSKSAGYETLASKREAWITELEAQRDPFDEATLEELQNE